MFDRQVKPSMPHITFVQDETMAPRFHTGEACAALPDNSPIAGAYVRLTLVNGEVSMRRLRAHDGATLTLEQFNPAGLGTIERSDIVMIERILTTNELFAS